MALTFRGGITINDYKDARKSAVVRMPAPETVSIPLLQHTGGTCIPAVKIGDKVDFGQMIGSPCDELGCPIHSSVSGIVEDIIEKDTDKGKIKNIIIKNDGENRVSPEITPFRKPISEITLSDVIEITKRAGLVEMSGSGQPIYQKLKNAAENYTGKIEYLVVNSAEAPYLTADYRLLMENPAAIINGLKILIKVLGLRRGIIAVEDNKLDAANSIEALIQKSKLVTVKILKAKYPQNNERQIVYSLTGREYGTDKTPEDAGCLIIGAASCAAIYHAFVGITSVERIVTVDGDCFKKPQNILVPIGASFSDVIEFCGGFIREPHTVISGSPLTGKAVWDMTAPVEKTTTAIVALSEKSVFKNADGECIHCGRCVSVCPMHLLPLHIVRYAKKEITEPQSLINIGKKYSAESCVECGACTYVCPGEVRILQYIRLFKNRLRAAENKTADESENIVDLEIITEDEDCDSEIPEEDNAEAVKTDAIAEEETAVENGDTQETEIVSEEIINFEEADNNEGQA